MSFFKKKQIDVNKPIVNPALKKAIKEFNLNKRESTLKTVVSEIKKANFLVLINQNEMRVSKTEGTNSEMVEKGSLIKFLLTFDENNNSFLPLFTDWNEIDLWVESRENIAGWIMSSTEAFNFVLKGNNYGLVINPCSDRWAMNKQQIADFLNED